jgi:WD40 repeat protein
MEDSWDSLIQTLTGHSGWVTAIAFSPEGKQVASGSDDETIKLWDATTGDLQQTLTGHSGPVRAVAFSRDGKQIASGSDDQTINLWDIDEALKVSRRLGSRVGRRLKFHTRQKIKILQPVISLKFSVDGRHLVTNFGLIEIESIIDRRSPEFKSEGPYPIPIILATHRTSL